MKTIFKNLYLLILLAIVISILTPFKLEAQYFGRNKVMYDNFNFKILHTKHFEIYYYNEEEDAVKYAADMAERWYTRHSELLGDTLDGP